MVTVWLNTASWKTIPCRGEEKCGDEVKRERKDESKEKAGERLRKVVIR